MSDIKYSSGISFPGMLTIVFIALKLLHAINWSWWWVFSPLWLGWALIGGILLLVLLVPLLLAAVGIIAGALFKLFVASFQLCRKIFKSDRFQ